MPSAARGDLFCAYAKSTRTLVLPTVSGGGAVIAVSAASTRLRAREFEVSCVSNFYCELILARGLVWGSEGEPVANAVALTPKNLNGEGSATSKCSAWTPTADGSNYAADHDLSPAVVVGAHGLARVPIVWKFAPGEIRVAKGQALTLRVTPTTNGDSVAVRLWWEELD